MLNQDWRNLADNAREFNLRTEWSLDTDNVIWPAVIFAFLCLAVFGFGSSFYYYELGHPIIAAAISVATLFSLRYIVLLLNLVIILAALCLSLGALFVAGYLLYCIGGIVTWSISDSIAQEKARHSATPPKEETSPKEASVEKPKWEGPDTSGVVDEPRDFKAINPEAWNGSKPSDPLGGLTEKPDSTQIVIEPGYKAVPCEGPFGKDTCIVKDPNAEPEEPIKEVEEKPYIVDPDTNQPINTYL